MPCPGDGRGSASGRQGGGSGGGGQRGLFVCQEKTPRRPRTSPPAAAHAPLLPPSEPCAFRAAAFQKNNPPRAPRAGAARSRSPAPYRCALLDVHPAARHATPSAGPANPRPCPAAAPPLRSVCFHAAVAAPDPGWRARLISIARRDRRLPPRVSLCTQHGGMPRHPHPPPLPRTCSR